MVTYKGYYSVIQYCPNAARLEAANVGVVLFCPEKSYLGARTSADNERVERFFGVGSFDPVRLNAAKRGIEHRLRIDREQFLTLEDFRLFIGSRANDLVLTPARPVKVWDPETDLHALFQELVEGSDTVPPAVRSFDVI